MNISDGQLEEFKGIYKELSGEELSTEKAYDIALKLIRFVIILYKPE